MVHPFHPLTGQEFALVGYAHSWGEHRVYYRELGSEVVRSLPASWTDVQGPNLFIVLGEGRSYFRVDDLLALVGLLQELMGREEV